LRLTKLKEARERAGLSQNKLAQQVGMTGDNISRLERGKQEPHLSTLEKLAQALDVAPEDLVDDPAELASKKEDALSILSVRYWLRERDAKRFSYADRTYVQGHLIPARDEGGVQDLLHELGVLTGEYRRIKEALQKPSKLPRAVRERRSEVRRDARRIYWRRVRFIDTTVYRLIEADPNLSDEEIEEGRESYDQAAAQIRRSAA
jgi:transcriptional regulator with XRE-family HTH domain